MSRRHRIEALDLVAIRLDANSKVGTKDHKKALAILDDAKRQWRKKFEPCKHCGK